MKNLVPFLVKSSCKIVLSNPSTFRDLEVDVQALKEGQVLLVNLTNFSYSSVQRITNFLAGSTHSLYGAYTEVGNGVYLFTPQNVHIMKQQ